VSERGRIEDGADPQGEREATLRNRGAVSTVTDLLDAHLRLYVVPRRLRSAREIARCFDVYVRPVLGSTSITELRRGHVVALLDKVAAENGPVMADRVLAHLRKALNWHAARDETFVVPIVRGMARSRPGKRARDRILARLVLSDKTWNFIFAIVGSASALFLTLLRGHKPGARTCHYTL
jgi:hypothetical protein